MVVDKMTQGSCIPIDSVKSSDDYSNLVHSIGIGSCIDSDKTNLTHLVEVMICRVGNIRVKRGRGVIWIIIKIKKIVVISHIIQETSKTNKEKQTNKQTKRKKILG